MTTRVNAYVLAGDPAWLEPSVLSYYPYVGRIVVSYDASHTSWTGVPLEVEECLNRLRAIDTEGKFDFVPGHYARLDHPPMANDTYQRQGALDAASDGADWVVQLDTDEVVADPEAFLTAVRAADDRDAGSLEYPAREMYGQVTNGRYLEVCNRWWGLRGTYPGPFAVRAGTVLRNARQNDATVFRVDFRASGTDPLRPGSTVDHVVGPAAAVVHYCWVRDDDTMLRKSRWSGHAADFDWAPRLRKWRRRRAHPWGTMALTPLRQNPHAMLKISRLPLPDGADLMRPVGIV